METGKSTRTNKKALPLTFSRIFNSLFIFLITFAVANIFHQSLMGIISYFFGYKTECTFASVHSSPHDYHYWSTPRVLLIYAFPLFLCIFIVIGLFVQVFMKQKLHKDIFRFFAFWMVINLMLLVTTYMSSAPFGQILHADLYQDIAVLAFWYGIDPSKLLILACLSLFINFFFGFIIGNELLKFSHVGKWQDKPDGRIYLFKTYFLFPLLLGIPATMLFSYPGSVVFHIAMVMHGLIYIPGIVWRYKSDFSSEAATADTDFIGKPLPILPVIFLILLLVVRIFLH